MIKKFNPYMMLVAYAIFIGIEASEMSHVGVSNLKVIFFMAFNCFMFLTIWSFFEHRAKKIIEDNTKAAHHNPVQHPYSTSYGETQPHRIFDTEGQDITHRYYTNDRSHQLKAVGLAYAQSVTGAHVNAAGSITTARTYIGANSAHGTLKQKYFAFNNEAGDSGKAIVYMLTNTVFRYQFFPDAESIGKEQDWQKHYRVANQQEEAYLIENYNRPTPLPTKMPKVKAN